MKSRDLLVNLIFSSSRFYLKVHHICPPPSFSFVGFFYLPVFWLLRFSTYATTSPHLSPQHSPSFFGLYCALLTHILLVTLFYIIQLPYTSLSDPERIEL